MATSGFVPLDTRQQQLCLGCGIDRPEEMVVIRETEDYLTMRHHKSFNTVSIHKSEAQKRKEKGLW